MVGTRQGGALQMSLMNVMYMCALIHIHSLLSTGQIFAGATSVSAGNGPIGCPFLRNIQKKDIYINTSSNKMNKN